MATSKTGFMLHKGIIVQTRCLDSYRGSIMNRNCNILAR
uniref:Uncharacterized protein n=1 Tax=Anguilla anguilla TaxID=7936 RepID=A0A0E9W7W1_ANGAN